MLGESMFAKYLSVEINFFSDLKEACASRVMYSHTFAFENQTHYVSVYAQFFSIQWPLDYVPPWPIRRLSLDGVC